MVAHWTITERQEGGSRSYNHCHQRFTVTKLPIERGIKTKDVWAILRSRFSRGGLLKPNSNEVRARQDPLRERYKHTAQEAWITDRGMTTRGVETDPFHGYVVPGSQDYGIVWPFGIHAAVGGYHDGPNPGDLLCAALAACLDSTIRIIAGRLQLTLTSLEVAVTAEVDVRGTLVVDRLVPVGFQKMRCRVNLEAARGTDPKLVEKLCAAAEHSCVNLQTLRSGLAVETSFHGSEPQQ